MENDIIRIGVCGLGVVGSQTVQLLIEQADLLKERTGRDIQVVACCARDKSKDRGFDCEKITWFDDPCQLAAHEDIQVVVELIGGAEGIARQVCETALKNGKHVVTANKALMAEHGLMLSQLAQDHHASLLYEAAVAGAIPVIKGIREGLAANKISSLMGILNGTCNYILTQMTEKKITFHKALKGAQELGYAEQDPTFDIKGIDAAHKLTLLSCLAFGTAPCFENIQIQGIDQISPVDIEYAQRFGYTIKLLAIAQEHGGVLHQMVLPTLIHQSFLISQVNGPLNAVRLEGEYSGLSLFIGQGAGGAPTACAVVADICDVAKGNTNYVLGKKNQDLIPPSACQNQERSGDYYVRLWENNQSGVMKLVTGVFAQYHLSVASLCQDMPTQNHEELVPVIFIFKDVNENTLKKALDDIEKLPQIPCCPLMLPIKMQEIS